MIKTGLADSRPSYKQTLDWRTQLRLSSSTRTMLDAYARDRGIPITTLIRILLLERMQQLGLWDEKE